MDDLIKRLEFWYRSQCRGEWEHGYSITIDTIDNPGWHMEVDLKGTPLERVPFEEQKHQYEQEVDWMICRKIEDKFDAVGGPNRLADMIKVFLKWAESTNDE